jgi:hypothetical protein
VRLVGSRKDYDHNHKGTLRFPHLSVDDMIHHLLSHGDIEDWLKVNQFFLEQMAYIAGGPDVIQEGERTALDNSILLLCSSMMSSHHDADQRLVVLMGGGSRTVRFLTIVKMKIARCVGCI